MAGRDDDEFVLDYKKGQGGEGGRRGGSRRRGGRPTPANDRIRASGRSAEAMVKVVSFGGTRRELRSLVDYVSRDGELDLKHPDGTARVGKTETGELIDEWASQFTQRKNARNVAHVMVSAPPGTNRKAAERAADSFVERAFASEWRAAYAVHHDTKHPHIHILLSRDGSRSPALRFDRAQLNEWRQTLAECFREQGVEMTATSRRSRGVAEKGEKIGVRKARERDGYSRRDVQAAKEVLGELKGEGASPARPWESALEKSLKTERKAYEDLALAMKALAGEADPKDAKQIRSAAALVSRQAMSLREVMTRRQAMRIIALKYKMADAPDPDKAAVALAKAYWTDRAERGRVTEPARTDTIQDRLAKLADGPSIAGKATAVVSQYENRLAQLHEAVRARPEPDRDAEIER